MNDRRDILDKLATHYKVRCRICGHHNSDMAPVTEVLHQAAHEIRKLRLLAGVTIDPDTLALVPDEALQARIHAALEAEGASGDAVERILAILCDEVVPVIIEPLIDPEAHQ